MTDWDDMRNTDTPNGPFRIRLDCDACVAEAWERMVDAGMKIQIYDRPRRRGRLRIVSWGG